MKNKVLIITRYYFPSIKGGGPIQSIKNLVENLSEKFEFYILAGDRDLGDRKPYNNIKSENWIKFEYGYLYYIAPSDLTFKKLLLIFDSINCDKLYINSFFDFRFGIQAVILNKIHKRFEDSIIVAPRGQFSPGALNLKRFKKLAAIKLFRLFRLFSHVIWHATSFEENKYICKLFGSDIKIITANNLTQNYNEFKYQKKIIKVKGELKIIFLSRIHPKKNLSQAISFLKKVSGKVDLNIYGPIEDISYWNSCERSINMLPKNISVYYHGLINHDKVLEVFNENHIFLFPTFGENYGHVISEALIGGCPVIISDQTPWRDLSKNGVGWDLDLLTEDDFVKAIQYCIDLSQAEYIKLSRKAFKYGLAKSNNKKDIEKYYELFN